MILGFTGTRRGMTPLQQDLLCLVLLEWAPQTVVHGEAVGADNEFHFLARAAGLGIHVVARPSDRPGQRVVTDADQVYPPEHPLQRNQKIVADCDVLLACPAGPEEVRSGTWYTVRAARKAGLPIFIITRNGEGYWDEPQ